MVLKATGNEMRKSSPLPRGISGALVYCSCRADGITKNKGSRSLSRVSMTLWGDAPQFEKCCCVCNPFSIKLRPSIQFPTVIRSSDRTGSKDSSSSMFCSIPCISMSSSPLSVPHCGNLALLERHHRSLLNLFARKN
ncbi:hypothetical protein TNCV_2838391 [Trichonephila clavipes]|nr:hypothetical protein TNCV_2838391 [Trichonephila clavipes]